MTESSRPRVLVVVGTRPEAIKMAPVVEALARRDEVDTELILTGQHSDLVAPILDRFGLRAARDLGIMRPGQTLYDVARGCLEGMRAVVQERQPEALLVQGDTATVAFTSLVGFLERVKVGHVEAGLRSGDKWAPWPEEIFRRLTDVLSDWYFAPTRDSAENLRRENVPDEHIHITGNPVVDALRRVTEGHDVENPVLRSALDERASGAGLLGVITLHRRESFGAPLREALGAILELAESEADTRWVYPVHPNPQVHGPAHEVLGGHPRIDLVEPLDYFDLASALRVADVVLTDSGGIQEEAPSFGTPVLVLREVTERPEGVDAGVAELVGTDAARITSRARAHLDRARAGTARRDAANPYGDGRAGERIADIVVSDLTGVPRTVTDWDAPA
ncbi:MAG: UDP-N-acetylglucosamine 2-epimerase (non-hydrolyzing) [Gemmatimonadetes bacterium]|nr:UDP-N-acetylglucosamine 2-epimerase (non-hydrolyzing) [Gemmatimonadota bacterium]